MASIIRKNSAPSSYYYYAETKVPCSAVAMELEDGDFSLEGLALIVLLLRTIAVVSILERDKLLANRVADQAALDAQRVALASGQDEREA